MTGRRIWTTGWLLSCLTVLRMAAAPSAQQVPAMNAIAERYVRLVLAVGQHDPDYVDAYYGPPEWKAEAERQKRSVRQIDDDAERLILQIPAGASSDSRDELEVL